jgi:hypothetical protein
LKFADEELTVALAYNNILSIEDYDRNETYLDPHVGYLGYGGDIGRVDGVDTLVFNWSNFYRKSSGTYACHLISNFSFVFGC